VIDPAEPLPWWWLRNVECVALGLGPGVRRTEAGFVFGDEQSSLRVEVLSRADDAPVRMGPISLRVWGDASGARAHRLLLETCKLLTARRGRGFNPDEVVLPDARIEPSKPQRELHTPPRPQAFSGPSTVIDIPSVCERACVFCGISGKSISQRQPRGTDEGVERMIEAATGSVLFTGDDALSNPKLAGWVAKATQRGLPVSVIGPPRVGKTAALAPQLVEAGLRRYITGIFGAAAATHDAVVSLPGAFEALREASEALRSRGVAVELLTPLVRPVLPHLAAIVLEASTLSTQPLLLMAYAPDDVVGHEFDQVVPDFDALRAALARADEWRVSIDAVPLCVLPPKLQARVASRLDRTDAGVRSVYPTETCTTCELKPRCPGVANTVHNAVGARGLVTLNRSAAQVR
jgi:hypothetical protein